jgi:hypothetical protein
VAGCCFSGKGREEVSLETLGDVLSLCRLLRWCHWTTNKEDHAMFTITPRLSIFPEGYISLKG